MAIDPAGETTQVRQRVLVHGATDQGIVREENQDSFGIVDSAESAGKGILLVIADGMGGLAGGGTASRIVVDSLCKMFREENDAPPEVLRNGIQKANLLIFTHVGEVEQRSPMGSTVTALVIKEGHACFAHVGDSRAYRLPPSGPIQRLTRDHTWVEELMKRGELEPGSLQHLMHRNILTRGVGLRPELEIDVGEVHDVVPGDTFLISTDGLHELVGESELEARIRDRGADLEGLVADLIQIARESGGPDNITAVVARVEARELEKEEAAISGETESEAEPYLSEEARLFPRRGFMPLPLLAAFLLGVGTVLLLEKSPLEKSPPAQEIDLLETFLEDPTNRVLFNTPDGKKLREALEDFQRKAEEKEKG